MEALSSQSLEASPGKQGKRLTFTSIWICT
jgi:hypothetical protein